MDNIYSYGAHNGSCKLYTVDSFNHEISNSHSIFVLNFNIRSFNRNFDEFSTFLGELKFLPDILILTETWFSGDSCGHIEGFSGFHCTREGGRIGGGVSIFIKNSLSVKVSVHSSVSKPEIEYQHIILQDNFKNIHVIGVYRPPNSSLVERFNAEFEGILEGIPPSKRVIAAGDFNICGLNQENHTLNYIEVARAYCLIPHISIPTRPNPNGNDSLLDHIWSNFGTSFRGGIFENLDISDHLICFVMVPLRRSEKKRKIVFRDHSDENILKMSERLENFALFFPLLTATLDFNSKFNLFFDEINRIYNVSCPTKTKELSSNSIKKTL